MLLQDLRYALRMLVKQPAFTFIVVITFALGIGANTAVFSVVNAVVLRPLPFQQPQDLVDLALYDVREGPEKIEGMSVSYPDFEDWRAQNRVFEDAAVYVNRSLTLTDGKQAMHVVGEAVSGELFNLLRVKPLLGRTFTANEDEPGNRAVIGFDPSLLSRKIATVIQRSAGILSRPSGKSKPFGITPTTW